MKHVIWQNYDLNPEDWEEGYKEFLEINEMEVPDKINDNDLYDWMYEENDLYLEDERINLNIDTEGRIICIADIGLWDGRRSGYKLYSHNIGECLYLTQDCDYGEFYVDEHNNLRSRQSHHDGTHYLLFREFKPEITSDQADNFCHKIYNGKATAKDITRYTRSLGKRIKKVYGW